MCETDYSGYPDCRDNTLKSLQVAISLGLDKSMTIDNAPDVARQGADLGDDRETLGGEPLIELVIEHTHSCYLGDREHRHAWGWGCVPVSVVRLAAQGLRRLARQLSPRLSITTHRRRRACPAPRSPAASSPPCCCSGSSVRATGMVRLRNAVVARFAPVDAGFRQRHALIERQVDLLAAALANAGPRLEALRAACRQADAAREHARARPAVASTITSLRVAEDILADARGRLPVQSVAGADAQLPEIHLQLGENDTTLAFARREFNLAVTAYNDAVRQFPTAILASLFGFRRAGTF